MAKLIEYLRNGKAKSRQYHSLVMREHRKLVVEIRRCRHHKRSHIPVKWKLEYARWDRKSKARMQQKKFRKG